MGGELIATAPVGNVFNSPWGSILGMFSFLDASLEQLCSPPPDGDTGWTGYVVGGKGFYGALCSYETRARIAKQRNASGILFNSDLHSPFDWDGSSQEELAPASFVYKHVYGCIEGAVLTAAGPLGSSTAIELLSSGATPLEGGWYLVLNVALDAFIMSFVLVNILTGLWQQHRFILHAMERSTRAVVGLETISQSFHLIRLLNGPGCVVRVVGIAIAN